MDELLTAAANQNRACHRVFVVRSAQAYGDDRKSLASEDV